MGFSPEWSPRVARPRLPSARSVCSLVYRGPRLPAPSSGRDYAGQSLSSCRVRRSSGCSGGGGWGKDRARARVRGTSPPTPSESLRDGGAEGRRWAPGPICPSRFLARVFRRVRPSRGRLRLGRSRSRGAVVPRVMRAVCSRAVRLSPRPPFLGSVPTAGGIAEVPLPPSGAGRTRVSRDGPRSRGRPVLGERRLVASGASSDVGTRCRSRVFGGRHRCRRGSLSCWCLTRAPVGPLGFRSARHRGRGGTAQGVCSVIPAGLPRVPGRRPSGLSVPCRGTFRGRPVAATPAVVAGPAAVAASCVVSEAACEGKSAPRG